MSRAICAHAQRRGDGGLSSQLWWRACATEGGRPIGLLGPRGRTRRRRPNGLVVRVRWETHRHICTQG
eukprot:50816-Eustigmatos_ZCMA.PRE.1